MRLVDKNVDLGNVYGNFLPVKLTADPDKTMSG
jgi:hypothetical protein